MATIGMCSTLRTARSRSAWPHCCMMPCCGPNRVPRAGKLREQAMSSKGRVRLILHLAAVGGLLLTTPGCESIRSAAGLTKEPPDEFAVVTKAPLIIPPDFNLKPPKPGAAPLNQVSPTQSAEAALYSDDPNVVAGSITGNYSQAEKVLLAQSGAANADDGIRQQIAADNRKMPTAAASRSAEKIRNMKRADGASPDLCLSTRRKRGNAKLWGDPLVGRLHLA